MNISAIIEGYLFLKGEEGLSFDEIKELLEIDENEIEANIRKMQEDYQQPNRGIQLELLGNKVKLVTKKEYYDYYKRLTEIESNALSQSALETLAIIAYNSPITRGKVDEIRGVSSSHMIHKLVRMELIKEVGRSDLPGRPMLYSTTDRFLDYFGLAHQEDLPKLEEVEENIEETDLFESRYRDSIEE